MSEGILHLLETANAPKIGRTRRATKPRKSLRYGAIVSAIVGALATTGGGTAVAQPNIGEAPNPALFVARDNDTTIYLFGTIHIVPCEAGANPPVCASGITPAIRDAIIASDEVWLEVATLDDILADSESLLLDSAFLTDGSLLSDYIPDDERRIIAESILDQYGGDASVESVMSTIDTMKPWILSMLIDFSDVAPSGDWGPGVDFEVADIAETGGIPILGFESLDQQMALITSDRLENQIVDLRTRAVVIGQDIDLGEINELGLSEVWDTWAAGRWKEMGFLTDAGALPDISDAEAAAALATSESEYRQIVEDIEAFYPLAVQEARIAYNYDRLIAQRNFNWMTDIEAMLDRSGTFFIAVGAAHLVGDDGLPTLLENAGAVVERVQ